MKQSCDNCGCSVYKGYCVNCDEEVFIMEQYYEQGMEIPDKETEFMKKYSKSVNNPLKQY